MRLLFIGDIVGRSGRIVLGEELPKLRQAWRLDCVIVNGENAAGGFGITEAILADFLAAGADCVTLGNHAFDQREALTFIAHQPRLIRPLNYPRGTPGSGTALIETAKGERVLVINLMGRTFMDAIDDPFAAGEREIGACLLGEACDAIIVDFHAEASSEKQAFAHFIDGRVSLVVGTHTHVPTADYQILPQGTAFITDVGMTGDYDFDHRHGEGGADPPLRPEGAGRTARAGRRRCDALRHRGRDRRARACGADRAGQDRRQAQRRAA